MRPLLALAALALLTPALAGCVDTADPAPTAVQPSSTGSVISAGSARRSSPVPGPVAVLPVELVASSAWVRPGETVTLAASAGAEHAWYAKKVGDVEMSGDMAGHDMASMSEPAPPPATFDSGPIAAGARASLTFPDEGFYAIHCHPHPWMRFNLTVAEDAGARVAHVQILDGAGQAAFRYDPAELRVAPGATVVFWNNGTQMHTATELERFDVLPLTGKSVTYTPDEAGDYEIVVVARDPGARGEARTRLLVDPMKPDEEQSVGPFTGEFQAALAEAGQAPEEKHGFESDYRLKTLKLAFTATSTTPVPPTITVSVSRLGGDPLGSASGATGEIVLQDLPEGPYTVTVTAGQGVAIAYEVTGTLLLDLDPSDDPAPEPAADAHAGH